MRALTLHVAQKLTTKKARTGTTQGLLRYVTTDEDLQRQARANYTTVLQARRGDEMKP